MFWILVLIGILFSSSLAAEKTQPSYVKKLQLTFPIRVRMDSSHLGSVSWTVTCPAGCWIISPEIKKWQFLQGPQVDISYQKGAIHLNGKNQLATHLFIVPQDGSLQYGDTSYDGVFAVTQFKDNLFLVNHLELEDYVHCVLPFEIYSKWPIEAQKAQSIAIRTYAIRKREKRQKTFALQKNAKPYDVKDTVADQVYKGRVTIKRLIQAAHDTAGIILSCDEQPINAMFCACCGGVVPSNITVPLIVADVPYLKREYPCNFCNHFYLYRWKSSYDLNELDPRKIGDVPGKDSPAKMENITIVSTDKAGMVTQVKCQTDQGSYEFPGKKLRSALPNIRSLCFGVEKKTAQLIFTGKGHGHLIGLCQAGMHQMAKDGWDHKKILGFYYPKTEFKKLKREW